MRATSAPTEYNLKLYLVRACVYAALQVSDQSVPPSPIGQRPGAPQSAVVAGAVSGVAFSSDRPAGVPQAPAGAGVDGGGRSVSMQSTYTQKSKAGQTCSTDSPASGYSSRS